MARMAEMNPAHRGLLAELPRMRCGLLYRLATLMPMLKKVFVPHSMRVIQDFLLRN